ncbi:ExbD/TolR family protein [Spirochaetota bacterium]
MYLKIKSRLQHKALIDITSLIDLIFLLVIFFMVTSSLGTESSITVHLPKAVQTGSYKSNNIVVSIDKKNEIFINDSKHSKDSMLREFRAIKKKFKNPTIVIRGDRKANYETIVKIIDNLNRAGISKFTIATIK